MAELPRGKTREVRRGGSGVLELLLIDFDREGGDGYVRIERPTSPPTTAQLVVKEGKPVMALHECAELSMGHSALDSLRLDAASDDSRLSIHVEVDLALISELHPEAQLHLDEEDIISGEQITGWIDDSSDDSSWWQQKRRTEWAQSRSTLDSDVGGDASSSHEILVHNPGEELEIGYAYLIDDPTPASSLAIASHLAAIGHPLLVLSRTPPDRLVDEYSVPFSVCCWLSERDDAEMATVNPGLESVRRSIDEFLRSASRAVIVVDGLEYLSGLHGFDRVLGMLRDLLDSIQSSDDIVLFSVDLEAWEEREQTLLLRECDQIPSDRMREWAERPAIVEGHPFCQDFEEIHIPSPTPIELEEEVKEAFQDAASRLISPEEELSKGVRTDLEPALEGFSVEALMDEMRQEDSDTPSEELEEEVVAAEPPASDEDAPLPDWATAPSANMGDEPLDTTPEVTISEEDSEEEPEEEPEEENVPEPEPVALTPRSPTINHRNAVERRVAVPDVPDSREMASAAMQKAASSSKDITTELDNPGYEALGLAHASMDEAGERARVVGDWNTDEVRNWSLLELNEMQSAVERAKGVRHEIPAEKGATPARLNVGSWGAAAGAAAETRRRARAPEAPDNPYAREAASRAQKVRTLTQYVVGSELAALYSDRRQMVSEAGIDLELLGRVTELAESGHSIGTLIERLEADAEEGKKLLKKMEKDSVRVGKLLTRLSAFEVKGIVDGPVGARYRKRLLSFEDMEEIESLLNDLDG